MEKNEMKKMRDKRNILIGMILIFGILILGGFGIGLEDELVLLEEGTVMALLGVSGVGIFCSSGRQVMGGGFYCDSGLGLGVLRKGLKVGVYNE